MIKIKRTNDLSKLTLKGKKHGLKEQNQVMEITIKQYDLDQNLLQLKYTICVILLGYGIYQVFNESVGLLISTLLLIYLSASDPLLSIHVLNKSGTIQRPFGAADPYSTESQEWISSVESKEELDAIVKSETKKSNKKLVLVDFYATWCAPCRVIAPVIEKYAQVYQRELSVVKCDVDDADELAKVYNISSLPSFLMFRNGNIVKEWSGADVKTLKSNLDAELSSSRSN
eukprot:CAMPEP_0182443834 /NCGR_PEP_ID=MMETSP1172-20130603/2457_1 /TAXON_ID=708627 /ORGANISM="Timspurckia oligopyrenoides, Strain CCMP3278" /LENGTH=228 /DNA_ID=CAMNT_0024639221 /DNA_START=229 /DNA_END=915 /DNA_ORIENTATION=+